MLREDFAALRGGLSAVGRSLPRHVQKEREGFLGCGDPANGFACLPCAGCDHQSLVTFACKGPGCCPRCGGHLARRHKPIAVARAAKRDSARERRPAWRQSARDQAP